MNINYQTQKVSAGAQGTATLALPLNADRIAWNLTNTGTNPIYVLLSLARPTLEVGATTAHFVLKQCTTQYDGSGGSFGQNSGVCFTGQITVGGTSPTYVAVEFAP